MIQPKILVVDDERNVRESLAMILEDEGYIVISAKDGEDALQKVKELKINLVILDIWLPKVKGTEILKELLSIEKNLPVIMISGHADIETLTESLKDGAVDFIEKPLIKQKVLLTVKNILRLRVLEKENELLKQENENLRKFLDKIYNNNIRDNNKINDELFRKILRSAKTDFNILIQGAPDTNRMLIAYMLHLQSYRSAKPFVQIECTTTKDISFSILDQVNQGTLFLNNVDNLDMNAQASILQLLQDKKNFRVIATSSEDLKEKVLKKNFREDLYYQLKEITINIP